jgi:hypothetical protein
MPKAFFTGYGASVVRFFVDATSNLLCADRLLEGSNRPERGQDEKTSRTEQQAVHSGAGR